MLDGITPAELSTVTAALADPTLSVDVLEYPPSDKVGSLRFTVKAAHRQQVDWMLAELRAADAFTECHWSGPVGKVSLVGRGFRAHHPRVRPLVLDTLKSHHIGVRDLAVSARRISITCAEHDVLTAVTYLHRTFLAAQRWPSLPRERAVG
ncbi:hypothetical protein [Kibdelosporangium philippinense]|uniref:hypothetical protein n=1 Tax=Kibdelosporangium philippinense TaxID=211113 RepID=UPI00360F2E63